MCFRGRAVLVITLLAGPASPSLAQQLPSMRRVAPADTFADAGARTLVISALARRDSAAAGLRSYEATVTERMHVGMAVTERLPLRSRTLYHREQIARIYWQNDGRNILRWIGRREGTPVMGDDWSRHAPFGLDFDLAEELDLDDIGVDLLFDPFGDRMDVFDAEFVQPVSAEGLSLYRFVSGDTMRIRLPAPDRTITLVEVVIDPREKSWETVEGSLWFDRETGTLVRAAYRPSGVWDEEVREPRSLEDVPGFLKPAIGTVSAIVIEYGLYEQRWWLPRRVFGEGMFDWGHGLVRMPLTIEWTMSAHLLNQEPGPGVGPGPGLVQVGTRRRGNDRRREIIQLLAPVGVDLAEAAELPPPLVPGEPSAFTRAELDPLIDFIGRKAGPPPAPPTPSVGRALLTSLRYDRVRGPSAGWSASFHGAGFEITPVLRLVTAVPDLEVALETRHRGVALELYRGIRDASDWNVADGLGNSFATLFFGHDGGDYHRVAGASLGFSGGGLPFRGSLSLFAESHRPIERQTDLSLATLGGGELRPNLRADRIDAAGARATLAGQFGTDVQKSVLTWRAGVEVAGGRVAWGRATASFGLTAALSRSIAGAIQLEAGFAGSGAPVQRQFLLGGTGTVRGARENAIRGPAFWLARTEAALGLPGMRAIAFLDLGWAGEAHSIGDGRPAAGSGIGASFMDGLFRFDLARGLAGPTAWRAYLYLDALL